MGKYLEIKTADFSAVAVEQVTPQELIDIYVESSPVGGGVVSGSGSYQANTQVEISAIANDGYIFSRWSDGNTNAIRTITVGTLSAKYTALFVEGGILEWEQGTYNAQGINLPSDSRMIKTVKCKVSSSAQSVVFNAKNTITGMSIGICLWKSDGTWIERRLAANSGVSRSLEVSASIIDLEISEVSLILGGMGRNITPSEISGFIEAYELNVNGLRKTIS